MGADAKDEEHFFDAAAEDTVLLQPTVASVQLGAALKPSRYVIQVIPSDPTAIVWICFGPYGTSLTATTGAGAKRIPLGSRILVTFEFNTRTGINDTVAAICSAGTADVWITDISAGN